MINSNVSCIDWTEVGLYVPVVAAPVASFLSASVVRSVAGTLSLLGPTTPVAPDAPVLPNMSTTHQMSIRSSFLYSELVTQFTHKSRN